MCKPNMNLASEDAKKQDNPSVRQMCLDSERTYREFAAKCERLAREPAAPVALALPVVWQPP